jgi:surface protein
MTLHVTKGTPPNEVPYTVSIPYASFGENSVAITNQQLIDDFNNKPPGTTYSYHITTNYTPGSFPTGDVITTPTVSNQSVKATPSLYATPLEYNPATQDGYVSQCCSTSSNASINYTIDDENVATIEPVTGKIIPIGTGITELVCSQSSNSEYEQATTRSTVIVSIPRSTTASVKVVPLIRPSNNTIMYTGNPNNIPNNSPLFILADIRGTPGWFAIVDDRHRQAISNYAQNQQEAIQFFTRLGQSTPVPFNNIVTTHVTNMGGMFQGATAFDHDISSWDTSRVMNMSFMFEGANMFHQPLDNWNTSNVRDMTGMFSNAFRFNQSLNNWNTGMVINMSSMFAGARGFNQNISNWNTRNVRDMSSMFWGAFNFNNGMPPWWMFRIPNGNNRLLWDVSNVIPSGFNFMFNGAFGFNTNISHWGVRSVNNNSGFRRNSWLIDDFTPRAILNAPDRGQ